jgi:uncharacterized protein (TIGR04222 family)
VFGCTGVGRSGFNPIDFNGPDFLAFWIPLTAIFFLVAVVLRWRARRVIAQPRQLRDPVDVALLAGGLERVAGSVLARLYRRGLITVEGDKLKASGHLPADATPCERIGFEVCAGGISAMSQLVMPLKPHVQSNVDALMDAKLLVDDATARAIRNMTLGCMAIPLLLGITKLIVGINRDRPVGFLIIGLIAAGFCTYFAIRRPLRTSAGDTALDALKDENEDLTPASLDITRLPDPTSAALAVALFGTAVLPGMAMSSIRPIFGGIDADGSSSGSGCGSGCGGGGGGSGCGGCGGH